MNSKLNPVDAARIWSLFIKSENNVGKVYQNFHVNAKNCNNNKNYNIQ